MSKCKLFSLSEKDKLVADGIISADNKVLDSTGLALRNAEFKNNFLSIYGEEVKGLGRDKNGTFVINSAAARVENNTRKLADKRYSGVDLDTGLAYLPGGDILYLPQNLPASVMFDAFTKAGKDFVMEKADGTVITENTLGDIMLEYPGSGFTKLMNDLFNKNDGLLPGLSLNEMETVAAFKESGETFASETQTAMSGFGTAQEFMEDVVAKASNISEDTKAINALLNNVIERTGTEYGVKLERDTNTSHLGSTEGGVISISPYNIGIHGNGNEQSKLAYVYMHEKAHIVTMGLLNSDKVYRASIEALYAKAEAAGITGYGMTNILEFAAESLTNSNFQAELKSVAEDLSLWDQFVQALAKAFKDLTGITIENDLLGQVLLANKKAMDGAPSSPLNGPMSASINVIMNMDMDGNYIGKDGDIDSMMRATKKLGITFKPGEGFFYTNYAGEEIKIPREQLPLHIQGEWAKYTNDLLFGGTDPRALETEEVAQSSIIYSKAVDPFNLVSIQSINDLHTAQLKITPPSATASGRYHVAGKEYFRTTESLGFGVTERQENDLLANAAHIGNFKDELGKRIYSDEYASENPVDYDSINEFVKDEAFERAKKEKMITLEEFNKTYKNPVAEDFFVILTQELARVKGELMTNHNVKKFHTDIVVWDNETRIAGEIDVLAELHDGSFTVMDIKTRRKGAENYEQHLEGQWSTEEKHTLQTNTYSNAMQKMGFKMNAPKIIMSMPVYPKSMPVNEATFEKIEGDDYVLLLDLKKVESNEMYDDKGQLTWKLKTAGPGGSFDSKLAVKSAAARNKYRFWREGEKVKEGFAIAGPQLNQAESTQQLKDNIIKVQNTLQQYTNFVKKNPEYGSLSIDLADVLAKIKEVTGENIDDLVMEDAILIANNFFKHAATQLRELQVELKNAVGDVEDRKATYLRIKNYKGVFAVAQELFETIEILGLNADQDVAIQEARENFAEFEGISTTLQTDLNITLKDLYRSIVAESYLGSKGEIKMMEKLEKEARAIYGSDADAKQAYINKERRSEDFTTRVLEHSRKEVNDLINKPVNDISMAAYLFNSDVSVNNEYVQLFHKMLLNTEQRFSTQANEEVVKLKQLSDKLGLSEDDIRAMTVVDRYGDAFLMSEYKIEFHNEVSKRKEAIADEKAKLRDGGLTEKEISKINKQVDKLKLEQKNWYKANMEGGRISTPNAKWKTDMSKLSDNQREALKAFKKISRDNHGKIPGQSLIMANAALGTHYYRLPGVLKTTFAHAFDGNLVGVAKKYWDEATKIELGDVEEGGAAVQKGDKLDAEGNPISEADVKYSPTGLDGKPIFTNPVFFRGRPKENQNLDLFTIYALELQNGIRYEVNGNMVADATIFLDMVNNSDFIQTTGMNKEKIVSLFRGEGSQEAATIKGDEANVSKMIEKMMKNRIFAMTQEYGGNVFGKDVNRLMATIGSYTAFASMSFKVLGSANNWVTGNVSAALEAVGGEFYTKKDFAEAKALYYNQIGGIVGDIGRPVKTSYINQMMAIFDAQGDRDILNNNFERRNRFTQLFQPGTTLAGYSMGEHEIHATIMLSIMTANKILNKKGEYLTRNGTVTKDREKAASLVDAYQKGENGLVTLQKWAEYSEFDTQNKLSGGDGQATIRGLIKDRVVRTQGAFDKHMQSELNRRWYGKLFSQFKKHMPPHLLNRFRGLNNVFKSTEELSDDQKYFNYNAKTEEYGYYVTFFRFLLQTWKTEKFNIAGYMKNGNSWKDLSKHERANMTKTITEGGYILGTYIAAMMAVAAADDDDDLMWGLIYLLRRQTNEGGLQYVNPAENWRILESPMAALSKLNNMIDTMTQILSMHALEDYSAGPNKGRNKAVVKAQRVLILDRLDQFGKGYNKRMYNNLTKE